MSLVMKRQLLSKMATTRVFTALSRVLLMKPSSKLTRCLQFRCQSGEATCTPGQWQLVSAICLQRPPVVTAERTPLEKQFAQMMAQMELESSLLSDHELHAKEDKVIEEKQKRQEESEHAEGDMEGTRLTALDLEDAWEVEAKQFTPAPRVTEADLKNDHHSVDRKLEQPLVLLVNQKLGDKTHWVLPQGPRQEGESMRQAAERILQNGCGQSMKALFLGNAPCGFFQYRFPPSAKIGTGAKVFFFKAWYKEGEVVPNKKDTTDYKWVTINELPNFCSNSYMKSIKEFLVDL